MKISKRLLFSPYIFAEDQTKFVFNVDTDKTSQSLQLLFQLPNVQQSGAQPQTSGVLTTSPASQNQNVCQTTVIQSKQNNLQTPNDNTTPAANTTFVYGGGGIIHHPCPIISQNQVPSLCNQHSQQVQVATQTPQQKTFQSLTNNQTSTNFLENPMPSQQQQQQQVNEVNH